MSVKKTLPVKQAVVSYDELGQETLTYSSIGNIEVIVVPKTDEKPTELGYTEVRYLGITNSRIVKRGMLVGDFLVESAIDLAGKKYKLILKENRNDNG